MDDHPGLARTGAGEHQQVVPRWRGDQGGLHRVVQDFDDPAVGIAAGGPLEYVLLAGEVPADETVLAEGEVVADQGEGAADLLPPERGVAGHDVDLEIALVVVLGKRREVALGVAATLGLGADPDGHRLAEDGETVLQVHDLLLVQEEQSAFGGGQRIADQTA